MLLLVKVNIHDGLLFRQLLFFRQQKANKQLRKRIFLQSLCWSDSLNKSSIGWNPTSKANAIAFPEHSFPPLPLAFSAENNKKLNPRVQNRTDELSLDKHLSFCWACDRFSTNRRKQFVFVNRTFDLPRVWVRIVILLQVGNYFFCNRCRSRSA